jgi:hypothetical protein
MRRIEVSGALQLSLDDRTIEVSGSGSELRAEVAGLRVRRPSLRLVASSVLLSRRLSQSLARRGLKLTITRHGAPFVELGFGVPGAPLRRLAGLARVRLLRS